MSNQGASAVIYFLGTNNTCFILVGKESSYLREQTILNNVKVDEKKIRDLENFSRKSDNKQDNEFYAKQNFTNQAKSLSKEFNVEIRYDEIVTDDHKNFTTTFRCLVPESRLGVVKGRKNESDADTHVTILREISEETGLKIDSQKTVEKITPKSRETVTKKQGPCKLYTYDTFKHEVSENGKRAFEKAIADRKNKHKGELFEMEFKSLEKIKNEFNSLNNFSRCAIDKFIEDQEQNQNQSPNSSITLNKGGRNPSRRNTKRRRKIKSRRKN